MTEVETFLEDNGFRPLEPTRTDWYRPGDGTAISDVHQRQFVRGENGVVPVEALIQSLPGGMPLELAEQVDRPDNQNYSFEQSESSHTHSTESGRLEANNHIPKHSNTGETLNANEQERSDQSGFYDEAEGRLEKLVATPGTRRLLIRERAEAAYDSLRDAVANRLRRFGIKVLTRQDKTENVGGVSRYRRNGRIEVSVPAQKLLSIIRKFKGRGDAPFRIAEALESLFQEEEFHAAEKISIRQRWEKNPDGKDFLQYVSDWADQEIAEFIEALDDHFLTTTSPAVNEQHQLILAKAIASSSRIYLGGQTVISPNGVIPLLTDLHLLDSTTRWKLLAEFFRQVLQIRKSGQITESTMYLPEYIEKHFDFSPEDFNQWIADVKAAEELFRELPADFPLNRQIIATEKILDIIESSTAPSSNEFDNEGKGMAKGKIVQEDISYTSERAVDLMNEVSKALNIELHELVDDVVEVEGDGQFVLINGRRKLELSADEFAKGHEFALRHAFHEIGHAQQFRKLVNRFGKRKHAWRYLMGNKRNYAYDEVVVDRLARMRLKRSLGRVPHNLLREIDEYIQFWNSKR